MNEGPSLSGRFGESKVNAAIKIALDCNEYHLLKDVMLPTQRGTTQIDHIIISKFGIFVVETKNYSGWIFGGEYQKVWNQTLFNKKTSFQNPLRQNYKHVATIIELLGIDAQHVFSVIVFVGESEFKTPVPEHVTDIPGMITYVKAKTVEIFTNDEVTSILNAFEVIRIESSAENINGHIDSLRSRFSDFNGRVDLKKQREKKFEENDIPELSVIEEIRTEPSENKHQTSTDYLKSKPPISNEKLAIIGNIYRIFRTIAHPASSGKIEKYLRSTRGLVKLIFFTKTVVSILVAIGFCLFLVKVVDENFNQHTEKTETNSNIPTRSNRSEKSFTNSEIEKAKNELLRKKVQENSIKNQNDRYSYLIELSSGKTIQADNGKVDGQTVTLINKEGLEMKIDLSQIKSVKKILL